MKKGREIFVIHKYLSAFYKYLSAFYKNLSAFLQTSLGLLQNNKNLSAFHKNLSGIQKAESSGSTYQSQIRFHSVSKQLIECLETTMYKYYF